MYLIIDLPITIRKTYNWTFALYELITGRSTRPICM